VDLEQLSRLPLLDLLSAPTLEGIQPLLQRRQVPAGSFVFHEGNEANTLFLLTQGEAEALGQADGQQLVMGRLVAPTFFGGMGAIAREPRSLGIRARTNLSLVVLPAEALTFLEERHADEMSAIFRRLFLVTADRLRRANRAIVDYYRKRMEDQRKEQRDNEFRHLLVHDLRSPLAICESGLRQVLERTDRYGPLTRHQERILKRSRRSALFLRRLIEEVLEVSQAASNLDRLEKTTLRAVLVQAIPQSLGGIRGPEIDDIADPDEFPRMRSQLAKSDIHITIEPPELLDTPFVVDRIRLVQVLMNLVANALKHAPGWLALRISRRDDRLHFVVVDRGAGIPKEFRDDIFKIEVQSRAKHEGVGRGFGMGLAGAARLIESLGGSIRAEDGDDGVGTKMSFAIPWKTQIPNG
jgi:signal transduction histidine kinase